MNIIIVCQECSLIDVLRKLFILNYLLSINIRVYEMSHIIDKDDYISNYCFSYTFTVLYRFLRNIADQLMSLTITLEKMVS